MSAIFPRRGRREDSDASYVDLSPPPPITEKRHHSPFSYLRIRKFSEGKSRPPEDSSPLPPVPTLYRNHSRNSSDPQVAPGRPQGRGPARSPGSESSNESTLFAPTPPRLAPKAPAPYDVPSMLNNIPSTSEMYLPAATMMMAAQHAMSPPAGLAHHEVASRTITATGVAGTLHMDKAKVAAKVGPLITMGLQNMTRAQTVVSEVVSSQAWSVVKTQAQAILAPAKDILLILDSVTKYIPALMVAESIFSVIIRHELDKRENDKNILVVYHTMSIFWFTLCDLQVIFKAADQIKASLDTFFEAVGKTMQDFGNFRDVYYRHNHFARALRSGEYRQKLTTFAEAFVNHKSSLQFILAESSAIKVNEMSGTVDTMSAKLDMVLQFISRQTPLEQSVTKQLEEHGGFEKALQNTEFLNNLSRSTFHEDLSPQVQATLGQGLEDALKANLPMFTLKVEAAQREMEESVERSTETILQQLNSGPHQLIKDEDIQAVWKSMNWRISCKARHFVDAVHNHFAQKFGEHKSSSGSAHPEQWTLNVLSQVIYYSNIADAIDDDGSGYISVHEVNQFFKSRPIQWSAVQWLSFWAAGWKQNQITYQSRCMTLFTNLEAAAKRVLPQNRQSVKSYIQTGGLSELWIVINSLNKDGLEIRGRYRPTEWAPLNELREEIMHKETTRIQSRLERIMYQLESPETVLAVLGTHRLEGFILCFLTLVLDRHYKIMNTANTLVLSEREFQTMTFSLRNLVSAFTTRYQTLTQSWKQQRLDSDFLVQCFAGGIFDEWHGYFEDLPTAARNSSNAAAPQDSSALSDMDQKSRPEDILLFPLPPQPAAPRNSTQYPRNSEHNDENGLAPPLSVDRQRRRSSRRSMQPDYFFNFDFEKSSTEEASSISEVYRKPKKPKLEDRIASLEAELSDIKGMLNQLIILSTPR
ncbi:hypothetical protein C8J57DRAFT_1308571 [Mycena rebaudengoi]|nr:hypothetical protein C8J57DRAFT_1308571 [Mycena rebaudengoi]